MRNLVLEWWLLVWVLLDTTTLNLCSADAYTCHIRIHNISSEAWARLMMICNTTGDEDYISLLCECSLDSINETVSIGSNESSTPSVPLNITATPTQPQMSPSATLATASPTQTSPLNILTTATPSQTSPSVTLTTTQTTTGLATPTTARDRGQEQREGTVSCKKTVMGLGVLAAGLGAALVGVVMGWVWHCRSNRKEPQKRDTVPETLSNPTYCSFAPSTQYSSQGPGDTPFNSSPIAAMTSFATYDFVRSAPEDRDGGAGPDTHRGVGGGTGEYHVLGEEERGAGQAPQMYEVPIITKPPKPPARRIPQSTEYSLLQHK